MNTNENAQTPGGDNWAHTETNIIADSNTEETHCNAGDVVTVLRSGKLLAKRWKADGEIAAYDNAKYFKVEDRRINNIREASALLTELEHNPKACILRGQYVGEQEAIKRDPEHKAGHARRTNDLYDDKPLHLVLIEVDNFQPLLADPVTEPEQACDEYIGCCLPKPFRDASFHWQLSNSAGHPTKRNVLKAHLWFWLNTPYPSAQLKAWAETSGLQADHSVFQKVQIHYTAAPVFEEGVADPVPVRSGFASRSVDAVALTITPTLQLVTAEHSTRREKLQQVRDNDPIARLLNDKGMIKSDGASGALNIVCPFEHEHTSNSGDSSTVYFPPHTNGYAQGHFKCLHAHCSERSRDIFLEAIGFDSSAEIFSMFDDVNATARDNPKRFTPIPAHEFASGRPPEWIIEGIWPEAVLTVVFGASGSGKTFAVLDMAFAVARGVEWRDLKVKQGKVVYIAAEGAGGLRKRLPAYARHHEINLNDVELKIINDSPNFLQNDDKAVAEEINAVGGAKIIIIDTLAQVTPGGNENSGEDMGKVLARCKRLHQATGAHVVLVHHSGKDDTRGARGWSGIRAAVDAELEVSRNGEERCIRVTKQKDGEDGSTFAFRLLPVAIGEDQEGKIITSCVVEHFATSSVKHKDPKKRYEKAVWRSVQELTELGDDIPVGDVIDHAIVAIPHDPQKRDRRREGAQRAIDKLAEHGFFEVLDNKIRLPHST